MRNYPHSRNHVGVSDGGGGNKVDYGIGLSYRPARLHRQAGRYDNGNASETKANESFDNGVFFDIEAKRTPSKVSKLFSKRSEHFR
jgi:hypothetical protein